MRLRLTRLVLITCTALLGIIALQVFWLFKSYEEQKEKLFAVVDNTMMETQILTGVNASLNTTVQSIAGDLLQDHLDDRGNIKINDTVILPVTKHYKLNIHSESLQTGNKEEMTKELLKMAGLDSSVHRTYTVRDYKGKIKKALQYKKVDLPFELALIDREDRIIACTTDTTVFKKTGMKTGIQYGLPVTLNPTQSGRAQLAFPGAGFYLLKGMWMILLLSLCLIAVCAFSFSYMVALFYKQKRMAEIRNDFMNNMTHELKTPISSVSVALELLQDDTVTVGAEVKQEYFRIAGNELKRLTMLVDKVLRMSALEKTEAKVKKEIFVVKDWIGSVVRSMKPLAEAGNARITVAVTPEGLRCFADENQMSSILQNLLENAIKYADKNKSYPSIQIKAGAENALFYLSVTDNGIGIAEQHLPRIFDKFFRVPTGDQHETKGYGLGLSYVKEIVRLHKGKIEVASEVKKGTTFTIIIPENG